MRPATLWITPLAVFAVCLPAGAVPDRPESAEAKKARVEAKLAMAGELFQRRQAAQAMNNREEAARLTREVNAILQEIAADLPSVTPVQGPPKNYTKLTMNSAMTKLDAFQFRTPPGKMNWNMNLEFVYPQKPSFSHWYILPRQGTMQGFRTFSNSTDYEEKGADLPKPNRRIVQPLQEGN